MRQKIETFADLIDEWGIAQLAEDIGLKYPSANAMKQRNSIPSRYWPVLLEKGRVPLTQAALYQVQARSEAIRKAKRQSEAA
jgi:hypothetical protein